jgi:hypothetical protein
MISVSLSGGDIRGMVGQYQTDTLRALKAAIAGATDFAKARMREGIRARTTSTRLPNIIGSRVMPPDPKLSYRPAGSIYPRGEKAEMILRQLAEGATITVRNRRALAIPLHNQRDARGALLPPRAFTGLVYIPSRKNSGRTVGILALPTSKKRNGTLRAKDRRMQAAKSRSRVQGGIGENFTAMFILVRTVRIPQAFNPKAIMAEAERLAPGLFDRALSQLRAAR